MKLRTILLISLLCCANLFAQNNGEVHVESLYLARDDGHGKAGEVVQEFFTHDIPIYCVVQLDSLKPVTVKMVFIAAKVGGVKPGTKVITSKYKTNGAQSQVYFTGKPDTVWVAGTYRIDIFIDDKPAQSIEFVIRKNQAESEKEKNASPKPKNTAVRKLRKS